MQQIHTHGRPTESLSARHGRYTAHSLSTVHSVLKAIPLSCAATVLAFQVSTVEPATAGEADAAETKTLVASQRLTNLPYSFIENQGQWETPARFVARRGTNLARFEPDAILLQVQGQARNDRTRACLVRMNFEGAGKATLKGESRQAGIYNFFIGNDPSLWKTEVPSFDAVIYNELYPGIDVRAHASNGLLEYDLLIAPGADPRNVQIRCEGIDALRIDRDGALHLETPIGSIRQLPPIAWVEEDAGSRTPVTARFVLINETAFGFAVPDWDCSQRLVIDPQIDWSTFVGQGQSEFASAVTVNRHGSVTIAGETSSYDFQTTPGAFDDHAGGKSEAYIVTLNNRGTRVRYFTYIGGSAAELVSDVILDEANGGIVLVGETASRDFPTTASGFDRTRDGDLDGFVAKIGHSGTRLVYSTYVGGSGEDRVRAVTLAENRELLLVGETTSNDFPVTPNAFQGSNQGARDVFVMSLKSSGDGAGDILFSTYLGGIQEDTVSDIAWHPNGLVVGGMTHSRNFPTTPNCLSSTYGGKGDGFLTRLSPNGQDIEYSTFIGGEGNDGVTAFAYSSQGSVVATGFTWSKNFPITEGAFQTERSTGLEVFVSCLQLAGNQEADAVWSTYLGGNKLEYSFDLEIDAMGGVTIAGETVSDDFPTTPGAISNDPLGLRGSDGYVARLSSNGAELIYSTYFGGYYIDTISALCLDGPAGVVIVGETISAFGFPTTAGTINPTFSGGWDVFVTHLTIPVTTR